MTNEVKVKMAVVGVGGMGSNHVRDLAKMAQVDLCAICDIDHAHRRPRRCRARCARLL